MIPEQDWFRRINCHEMASSGDWRRFLLICEPERGKGIYGVGYQVPQSRLVVERVDFLARVHGVARRELDHRLVSGLPTTISEGSPWEVFKWEVPDPLPEFPGT